MAALPFIFQQYLTPASPCRYAFIMVKISRTLIGSLFGSSLLQDSLPIDLPLLAFITLLYTPFDSTVNAT